MKDSHECKNYLLFGVWCLALAQPIFNFYVGNCHFLIPYFYFLIIYFFLATKVQRHKESQSFFNFSVDNYYCSLLLLGKGWDGVATNARIVFIASMVNGTIYTVVSFYS